MWAVYTLSNDGAVCDSLPIVFSGYNMIASRGGEKLHFRLIIISHSITAASLPSCIVECIKITEILITSSCLEAILAILWKSRSREPVIIIIWTNHVITSSWHFTQRLMRNITGGNLWLAKSTCPRSFFSLLIFILLLSLFPNIATSCIFQHSFDSRQKAAIFFILLVHRFKVASLNLSVLTQIGYRLVTLLVLLSQMLIFLIFGIELRL